MKIGIIQGRLSPPVENHIQEFPQLWKYELDNLRNLELNHIEWIVTKSSFPHNPIFFKDLSQYPISSICADNLINNYILNEEFLRFQLYPICKAALKNNIEYITIPLLEESTMVDKVKRKIFCKNILQVSRDFPDLKFSFEAELHPDLLLEIVNLSNRFFTTYDTGNMTSCGFIHEKSINLLFDKISNVHLKDRTYDGRTKLPGLGETNFENIFQILNRKGYNKLFTLQTAREKTGDEKETILKHKRYFEELYFAKSI